MFLNCYQCHPSNIPGVNIHTKIKTMNAGNRAWFFKEIEKSCKHEKGYVNLVFFREKNWVN